MSGIRTLIIDDDVAVAGIHHGFLLARGGFEVVGMAHTGRQGLDMATSLLPELVLLDIHLPDMSGLDVLQTLRNMPNKHIDVIVITASRELDTVRSAMAGGVLHYLVKPFTSQALNERLDEYLALRRDLDSGTSDGPLNQERIDQLLAPARRQLPADPGTDAGSGASADSSVLRLPKGLSRPTLDAVMETLRTSPEDVSAAGMGMLLGLSRVSARRYLEYLVGQGFARLTPRYGVAGRPENRYAWKR